MLKIKHLISYKEVSYRGYFERKRRNDYLHLTKNRVDPICALLKLDETHNGYNIYSGCFIMVHHMNIIYMRV